MKVVTVETYQFTTLEVLFWFSKIISIQKVHKLNIRQLLFNFAVTKTVDR